MKSATEYKHLWEVQHSYYCNLGTYNVTDTGGYFKTWTEFYNDFKDADKDYNLLFRWDWIEVDDNNNPTYNSDDYYRNGKLYIFWIGQRKGLYRYDIIEVCRKDEPEVIKFLHTHFEHLQKLWEPIYNAGRVGG